MHIVAPAEQKVHCKNNGQFKPDAMYQPCRAQDIRSLQALWSTAASTDNVTAEKSDRMQTPADESIMEALFRKLTASDSWEYQHS